jgi:hypothetical protein
MPSEEKLRQAIASIIENPRSVRYGQIKWVLDQLGCPRPRRAKHGQLFKVQGRRLMINEHNDGKNTIPQYCVDDFRDIMIDLGLYKTE